MRTVRYIAFLALLVVIVAGHVGLWQAEEVPRAAKLRLTMLNAVTWAVIILPAIGVSLWLRATKRRNRER